MKFFKLNAGTRVLKRFRCRPPFPSIVRSVIYALLLVLAWAGCKVPGFDLKTFNWHEAALVGMLAVCAIWVTFATCFTVTQFAKSYFHFLNIAGQQRTTDTFGAHFFRPMRWRLDVLAGLLGVVLITPFLYLHFREHASYLLDQPTIYPVFTLVIWNAFAIGVGHYYILMTVKVLHRALPKKGPFATSFAAVRRLGRTYTGIGWTALLTYTSYILFLILLPEVNSFNIGIKVLVIAVSVVVLLTFVVPQLLLFMYSSRSFDRLAALTCRSVESPNPGSRTNLEVAQAASLASVSDLRIYSFSPEFVGILSGYVLNVVFFIVKIS